MRKRRATASSFELFLDTLCNVFGGIIFIAILIAIQIKYTEGIIKPPEALSPEQVAEMQRELDQISMDIDISKVLFETILAAMPKPADPAELERAELFYKLSAARGSAISKETELLHQQLAMERELLDWEDKIKNVETLLRQKENERRKIDNEIEIQQTQRERTNASAAELQSEIDNLNQQIARKEQNLASEDDQPRNEMIYLPRLRDAGDKRPVYFVLRFSRFYAVNNRDDFDYIGNTLGTPKKNRGIPVDDMEESNRQILSLFRGNSRDTTFLSVFVYGDSADQWYIIRDLFVAAGFEYQLIPTQDDTPWVFGGRGGSAAVQ